MNPDRERLLDLIFLIRMRVLSGRPLGHAIRDLPPHPFDRGFLKDWRELVARVSEGRLEAAPALEALESRLRTEIRTEGLIERAGGSARAQATSLALLCVLFQIAAWALFPEQLRPGWIPLSLSVALNALAFAWATRLTARVRSALWLGAWVKALRTWAASLAVGDTSVVILGRFSRDGLAECLPIQIKKALLALRASATDPAAAALAAPSLRDPEIRLAWEQISLLDGLLREGLPLRDILAHFAEASFERLDRKVSVESERLKMKLMGPLFLCQMPAFLVLLAAPLLSAVL